jgi:hypothetical protein
MNSGAGPPGNSEEAGRSPSNRAGNFKIGMRAIVVHYGMAVCIFSKAFSGHISDAPAQVKPISSSMFAGTAGMGVGRTPHPGQALSPHGLNRGAFYGILLTSAPYKPP